MILGGYVVSKNVHNPLFSGTVLYVPAVTSDVSFTAANSNLIHALSAVSEYYSNSPARTIFVANGEGPSPVPKPNTPATAAYTDFWSTQMYYSGAGVARARKCELSVTPRAPSDITPAKLTMLSVEGSPVEVVVEDLGLPEGYIALFVGSGVAVGGETVTAAFDVGILVRDTPFPKFLYTEEDWAALDALLYVPIKREMAVFRRSSYGVRYGHTTWRRVLDYGAELQYLQGRYEQDRLTYPETEFKLIGNPPLSPFIIDTSIISYVS